MSKTLPAFILQMGKGFYKVVRFDTNIIATISIFAEKIYIKNTLLMKNLEQSKT